MKSIHAELHPAAAGSAATARGPTLKIVIVGSGYVVLVTAACLASYGHSVLAIDTDEAKAGCLVAGEVMLYENGLEELVREQLAAGRLRFTSECDASTLAADLVFVAVGTPSRLDGSTDTRAIDAVARSIATSVHAPTVVVLKSTVPVGTAQRVQRLLADACPDGKTAAVVLSNPEFLREGSAVADFSAPERIVIGDDSSSGSGTDSETDSGNGKGNDSRPARRVLLDAYAPLVRSGVPVLTMDTRSAELSKLAANAMLATRISFVNEIAAIASATGADIEKVCEGIGSDRRIGPAFLRAGLGYGGSCLPKDVAALRETARRHNLRADMLLATERVNDRQRCWAFREMQRDAGSRARLRGLRVALWGLAFKPGTDDVCSAPSLALVDCLVSAGVHVSLYDPAAMPNARRVIAGHRRIVWADSAAAALAGTDVLVLATEWPEFVDFDPAAVARELRLRTVYDGRNALDAAEWGNAGLRVRQIGRPPAFARVEPMPLFIATVVAQPALPVTAPGALQMSAA